MSPILFLLVIIALIFISRVRIPLGKTRLAVALYLALLLAAIPAYYVVAKPTAQEPAPDPELIGEDDAFWEEYSRRINEFYEAAHERRLKDFEGAQVVNRQEFEYEGESILITAPGTKHYGSSLIVVEHKDVNDGMLEIIVYEARFPYRSGASSNPPEFALNDERLEILLPRTIRVEEIRFHHDFTMAQFSGRGMKIGSLFPGEQQVIYLRIPRDLRIETDQTTEYSIFNTSN